MVSGRWVRLGTSALTFLLLIATIFTPHVYDPKTDPPYAYYKKVVRDIDLEKDSLLIAHLGLNAGSGAYGFVYGINGSVDFLSFRLYAGFENGIGGVIPYTDTPLKANNNTIVAGLIYLIK